MLPKTLSVKSDCSVDSFGRKPSIASSLLPTQQDPQDRGRSHNESNSDLIEASNNMNLSKSPSNASVRSVQAVGNFPLGTLHVHSPGPTHPPASSGDIEWLKSGDVFIVRDIPEGAIIGYDTQVLTISKRDHFEGIKDISPGVHLIWGGSGVTSLRNGFWFISSKLASDEFGEVYVKRWDKQNEIIQEEVSMAEVRIQKSELPELLPKLLSYTASVGVPANKVNSRNSTDTPATAKDPTIWLQLTSCVKGAMLSKVTGQEWNHWQVSSVHDYSTHNHNSNASRDATMNFDNYKDEVLNFMFPRDTRTFSKTSIGRMRTEQALDSTSYIEDVISNNCTYQDSDEIIGELQFCYLTGMLLGNIACMEHWSHVVKTVFHAYALSMEMPVFVTKFIQAIHTQFRYDQDYLDGSILDHDSQLSHDLKMTLTVFKSRLNEQLLARGPDLNKDQTALAKAFDDFEEWLWKWDWDLRGNYVRSGKIQLEDGEWIDAEMTDFQAEDERGEWAPVVVELDEQGRGKDFIRF